MSTLQVNDHADCALLLAGSEAICEDTFLTNCGEVAVRCVMGDELVAFRHCDLRSRTGRLIECGAGSCDDADGGPSSRAVEEIPSNIFATKCTTDDGSWQELGRYPSWELSRSASSTAALDPAAFEGAEASPRMTAAAGSRKRIRDD